MGFGEAISSCFSKYATFSGRARRSEYWFFYLFTFLIGLGASVIDAVIDASTGSKFGFIRIIVQLAVLLPSLGVWVRRLHDTNHSGWLILGFFVYIFVGFGALIGVLVNAGTAGKFPDLSGPAITAFVVFMLGFFGYGIFLFVLTVLNGTPGANRYGPDPKGPDVAVFS